MPSLTAFNIDISLLAIACHHILRTLTINCTYYNEWIRPHPITTLFPTQLRERITKTQSHRHVKKDEPSQKMFKPILCCLVLLALVFSLVNCAPAAHCYLTGTSNAPGLRGLVLFTQNTSDLTTIVTWSLDQSTVPTALQGKTLGFHVHEYGYIATANSTGSHFNPNGSTHALPSETGVQIHAGDLGNLNLANGYSGVIVSNLLKFSGDYSLVGRAVRLHMSSDKGSGSQPTGAAGDPAAHCVIGIANGVPNTDAFAENYAGQLAAAVMRWTSAVNYNVTGRVVFTNQTGTGLVRVTGKFCGLPANSIHGLHIHQYGQLNYTDPSQVGGHWNPNNVVHGYPGNPIRHVGDLGNITADATGVATIDLVVDLVSLSGVQSILGRAVVLHNASDDGSNPEMPEFVLLWELSEQPLRLLPCPLQWMPVWIQCLL